MTFSYLISVVTKHEKLILFIDLDAEFHVLKLLFEDYLPKIIRDAGNCESLILRVKFQCLKYGRTHGMLCFDSICTIFIILLYIFYTKMVHLAL